ncbi:MAG: hypothetical protein IPP90_04020 [Gemmatimonadaceae bacterium]|nr:hypothetical protein [Gemmatimonadaceae bacterium]
MNRSLAMTLLALSLVACAPRESPAQPPAARWRAQIEQAEAAARRGDRREASRLASAIVAEYGRTGSRISAEHVNAGRAYVLLSSGDASAARAALAAFDAGAADSTNLDATRRTGNLFLEKYNAPDARLSYESVLKRAPNDPEALLGLAQVEEFEGKSTALATARKALAANPQLVGALAFVARMQLEAEQWDSATVSAHRALAADSTSIAAWSVLGAVGWLKWRLGDVPASRGGHDVAAEAIRLLCGVGRGRGSHAAVCGGRAPGRAGRIVRQPVGARVGGIGHQSIAHGQDGRRSNHTRPGLRARSVQCVAQEHAGFAGQAQGIPHHSSGAL